MKRALAAVAVLAVGFSLYVANSEDDPAKYDIDGNGGVNLGDVAAVLSHVGERVDLGACYTLGQYATPVSLDGYTFDKYLLVPEGHPAAAGTPVSLRPC